jgi:hypothetical protein
MEGVMPNCPDDSFRACGFHLKSFEDPFCYLSPDYVVAVGRDPIIFVTKGLPTS